MTIAEAKGSVAIGSCNICGSTVFEPIGARPFGKCKGCGSVERTRALKLFLDELGLPKCGSRVLHFAPERGLAKLFIDAGCDYDPRDFDPARYPHTKTKHIDLIKDAEKLPERSYDLILHCHVLEHVPCDITTILYHLHRALKDDGWHVCCIPIFPNKTYAEDLGKLDPDYATKEFGQFDHVRRWGALDLDRTLGMALKIPEKYDLVERFGVETLKGFNIPEFAWRGWQQNSILVLCRGDMKLLAS